MPSTVLELAVLIFPFRVIMQPDSEQNGLDIPPKR